MKKILYSGAAGIAAAAILASAPALATEGYFTHGLGAVNKSMAGAGVATGFDAMSAAINPAALTGVDPNFTLDLSLFSPRRESTLAGSLGLVNGNHESSRNIFFIPALAGSHSIDLDSTWG